MPMLEQKKSKNQVSIFPKKITQKKAIFLFVNKHSPPFEPLFPKVRSIALRYS
jgi:hypothetical protein